MLKKIIWANFQKNCWSFYPKNFLYAFKYMGLGCGIRDPGSGKTYSGSRIQGSKRHRSRIPDPDPQHCCPPSCNKPRTRAQQWRLFLILGSRTPVLLGMRCPERDSSPILSVSLPTFPAKSLGHLHSSGACSWSSDQGPRYCWGSSPILSVFLPTFSPRKNILLHALFPEERSCEFPPFGNFHLPFLLIIS
jgi:hypothetical protein